MLADTCFQAKPAMWVRLPPHSLPIQHMPVGSLPALMQGTEAKQRSGAFSHVTGLVNGFARAIVTKTCSKRCQAGMVWGFS